MQEVVFLCAIIVHEIVLYCIFIDAEFVMGQDSEKVRFVKHHRYSSMNLTYHGKNFEVEKKSQ